MESLEQYISSIIKSDEQIKIILDKAGLIRSVSSYDREYYKTWTNNWGFADSQIYLICEVSVGKSKTLGNYHMMMGQNPVYIITLQGKMDEIA
jgi:hypothetical protein